MTTVYSNLLNGTFVAEPIRMPDLEHEDHDIDQFRGIQFAEIKHRFGRPQLKTDHNGNTIHAIHPGPICPLVVSQTMNHFSIPENLRQITFCESDELGCLNLTITRPRLNPGQSSEKKQLLPVVIWIHGGGHYDGSGYYDVYQPQALVHQSMAIDKPIIVVSLQYRLGPLGWLSIDGKGNLGLHDQRVGILWVHHFINDFGGDRDQVTIWGSGTGAADINYHCSCLLNSDNGKIAGVSPFNRVISVEAPVAEGLVGRVLTKEEHAEDTDRFCKFLNVKTQEDLIKVPLNDLLTAARQLNYWVGRLVEDHDIDNDEGQGKGQEYNDSDKFWTKAIFPKLDAENATVDVGCSLDALMSVNAYDEATALGQLYTQTLSKDELKQILAQIPEDIKADAHWTATITPEIDSKTKELLARCLGQRILEQRYIKNLPPQYHHQYRIQFDLRNPFQTLTPAVDKKSLHNFHLSYKYIYNIPDLYMWHAYNFTDINDPQSDVFAREIQNLIINFINGEAVWSDDIGHTAMLRNHQIKLVPITDKKEGFSRRGSDEVRRNKRWQKLDSQLDDPHGLFRQELIGRALTFFNDQNPYPAPLL